MGACGETCPPPPCKRVHLLPQQHSTGIVSLGPATLCLFVSQWLCPASPPHCLSAILSNHTPAACIGECGTKKLMGTDFFTYLTTKAPEEFAVFDKTMASLTAMHTGPAVAGHDWGRYTKVVDVGGGFGTLLEGLLRANPGEPVGSGGQKGIDKRAWQGTGCSSVVVLGCGAVVLFSCAVSLAGLLQCTMASCIASCMVGLDLGLRSLGHYLAPLTALTTPPPVQMLACTCLENSCT